MSRFLVTGGAAAGHEVAVLDDISTGRRANLDPRATLHEGSILDEAALTAAMEGGAGCFHLAAVSSALAAEIPVVYASTAAVYGDCASVPVSEQDPARPIGFYGAAKLAAEQGARLLGARSGLRTIGLRYFNVYGPRQDPASPYSGVIAHFTAQALRGEILTVLGSGAQTRDFVAAADIVAASVAAIGQASAAAPVVNVGSGGATRIVDLARLICEACGRNADRHVRFGPARGSDIAHSVADTRLLRATLGLVPANPLAEGLHRLASPLVPGAQRRPGRVAGMG